MDKLSVYVQLLAIAALVLVIWFWWPCRTCGTAFTIEVGCSIALTDYICTQSATPSTTKRFVIETVSFSGQATQGQTVGASFSFNTGGTPAFVWLPVNNFGPSPSAGNGVYAATLSVRLSVDANSSIRLEAYRNSSANAGQTSPYVQRLNLMGYLQ
jgi:hypothetical protein